MANAFGPRAAVLFFSSLCAAFAAANDALPRSAWTSSNLRGRPTPPDPYEVEPAFENLTFSRPTSISEMPGLNRLMVGSEGKFLSFPKQPDAESTTVVCDLNQITASGAAISSATFDPSFTENRFVYMCYRSQGTQYVTRFTLDDSSDPKVIVDSKVDIITWPSVGHTGGCMRFGRDGYLYISTGDSSGPAPPDARTTGQDVSDLLGSVLRIDVSETSASAPYKVPSDNPFVDLEDARDEIWSYGLRNPWKFNIDRVTGIIFVADNGWETWESIHKLHPGSNCGWPIMEGRELLRTEVERGPTPITPPVKDHPHTEANSVIGGPVYRGARLPGLIGNFVYGDYITGTIWGLKAEQSQGQYSHRTLVDTDLHIVDFLEDRRGDIYILDHNPDSHIHRLVPSDAEDTSATFPRLLSETGLFDSTGDLTPAPGVVGYDVLAKRWMDGADTRRWIAIPGSETVDVDPENPKQSRFPEGTVLVKHASLQPGSSQSAIHLETQLLHLHRGKWNPYSYVWNEQGTDATLAPPQGIDRPVRTGDTNLDRTWHVGSVNECRLCHSAGAGVVLGFTARQLNQMVGSDRQLDRLRNQRVMGDRVAIDESSPRIVDPHDETASLDDRARSYLHANCGICHRREGPATVSFYAHRDYPFDQLRITKQPGIGTFGLESPKLVAAGAPQKSVILYRMAKLGYGRMPYVGSHLVDSKGVALIDQWIAAMDSRRRARVTGSTLDGSTMDQIDQLLATTEGAMQLAVAMHRGDVPKTSADHIRETVANKNAYIRGVFDHFLPESKRRKTVGSSPDAATLLAIGGDAGRGELIFLSDNARCRSCHDVSDAAKSTGPTLTDIRIKYKRPSELLANIIRPSAQIDDKFTTWTVLTSDGRAVSGIVLSDDNRGVQLRSADGRTSTIAKDEIDAMRKSDRSIMPDGTLSDLTPQEAADLLAFLMGPPQRE